MLDMSPKNFWKAENRQSTSRMMGDDSVAA
jgi:hypothetical protein